MVYCCFIYDIYIYNYMQVFIDVLAFAPGKLLPKTAMERGREREIEIVREVYTYMYLKNRRTA